MPRRTLCIHCNARSSWKIVYRGQCSTEYLKERGMCMASKKTEVRAAVVCHKGCVRSNNEDNFFLNGDYMPLQDINKGAIIEQTFTDSCQVYSVFDGMGGGDWGERASSIAAQMMQSVYLNMGKADVAAMMKNYAYKANGRIQEDSRSQDVELQGTTMATLILRNGTYYVSNVGDSRVYLLRNGKLKQLSMDHSVVGDMVRQGQMTLEQARKSPQNNIITHYLGMRHEDLPRHLVYQTKEKMKPGDRYMICSDGLCDMLSEMAIRTGLGRHTSPFHCARDLVMAALEMGGKDNTTCLVVDYGAFEPLPEEEPKRKTTPQMTKTATPVQEEEPDDEITAKADSALRETEEKKKTDEEITSLL